MKSSQEKEETKRAYEKPRLRIIELAAEEVLAAGCKTTGVPNPLDPASCLTNSCVGDGS